MYLSNLYYITLGFVDLAICVQSQWFTWLLNNGAQFQWTDCYSPLNVNIQSNIVELLMQICHMHYTPPSGNKSNNPWGKLDEHAADSRTGFSCSSSAAPRLVRPVNEQRSGGRAGGSYRFRCAAVVTLLTSLLQLKKRPRSKNNAIPRSSVAGG